jgi:nucleolysin TIA-1/TIAR
MAMTRANSKPRIGLRTELLQTIQEVFTQSPYHNTTVYIGNIPLSMTDSDLGLLFQPFGYVFDVRIQVDRG